MHQGRIPLGHGLCDSQVPVGYNLNSKFAGNIDTAKPRPQSLRDIENDGTRGEDPETRCKILHES